MKQSYKIYHHFEKKLLIIGFGAIGQAIIPLIFRHLTIKPEQITILSKKTEGISLAKEHGVHFVTATLTKENYADILNTHVQAGDFILNLSVDVSSADLIQYCQSQRILYTDTCIEPWEGGYVDQSLPASLRSNYAMREALLALRSKTDNQTTALVAHGANPGLVSHFVKEALLNIANDNHISFNAPASQTEWAQLACLLGIKTIHIAERDTQVSAQVKNRNEFVNTWSIDGFISEGMQPAELGWGTHEKHWPSDAAHHDFGAKNAIYLHRPGAKTRVRTWTPLSGAFHGYLITHTEAISISHYFTLKENEQVQYRPTVHFAYHPCDDAVLSVHEVVSKEWQQQPNQRILFDEIVEGMDELGVLLMGHVKGAYWFGSQLSIHEARQLVPNNNATSLQVAIGAFAGMVYVMQNPDCGIVEPDEIDFQFIMDIVKPYLGKVCGYYTDWTPLKERAALFPEKIDLSDPWQFINMRVD